MIEQREKIKTYDAGIDLIRVYGIFCVAYAHCFNHGVMLDTPAVVSSVYVNQLFIFMAGWFYHREQDEKPYWSALKRDIRAYLVPFFCWNLVYGIIRMGLNRLGVVEFGEDISFYTLFLQPWGNSGQFMLNVSSWFLLSLFLVSAVNLLLRKILRAIPWLRAPWAEILLMGLCYGVSIGLIWRLHGQYYIRLTSGLVRLLILLPYYQLGIVLRRYREKISPNQRVAVGVAAAVVALVAQYWNGEAFYCRMLYCYFSGNALLITIAATACIVSVTELSIGLGRFLPQIRLLRAVSRSTKYIMLHHIFVLYLMQLGLFVLHWLGWLPAFDSASFRETLWYRFYFDNYWVGIAMVIVALLVPVGVHWVYEQALARWKAGRTVQS